MGAVAELGSRAIRGMFYEKLEGAKVASWVDASSNLFTSDQDSETYKWLSQSPVMREWLGGRQAKAFTANGITIENKKFEATIGIEKKDLRRDKTGQIMMRIGELVERSQTHWASLLSTLLLNGTTGLAYDGKAFFAADHSEGNSGTLKNLLTSSEYAALNVATATAPTPYELANALVSVISHFYTFKDDQGEPRNEDARAFQIQTPVAMWGAMQSAVSSLLLNSGSGSVNNPLVGMPFRLEVIPNGRLTWTDRFAVLRSDAQSKPLIRQEETAVDLKILAEGSDYEFNNDAWQFGIDANRNAGYGLYSQAILAVLS